MTVDTVPARREIAPDHTWNAASVFPSPDACEAELKAVAQDLAGLQKFHGRLAEGPATLVEAFGAIEHMLLRGGKVRTYATMAYNVDTTDPLAARLFGQMQGMYGQLFAAIAFLDPELLALGQPTLHEWLKTEPRLKTYEQYIENVFRKHAYTRSTDVEEVLGMLKDVKLNVEGTASLLTNADFKFEAATATGGQLVLTQGTLARILSSPDREARRTAWENYTDLYLAHKNTLANNLLSSYKLNVLDMRARRHESTLALSLSAHNVPIEVFHNLIAIFRKNLPTWRRYWAIRRKALGVETLHPYDIWAPLTAHKPPTVPYGQAVEWVCEGLKPLGAEYVAVMRRGCLEERWVDIYPNQGKTNGAFSDGWKGTHPFILMSYNDNMLSMSTLAHELGHSMHSYLIWQNQPMIYSQYSLFIAEVASNFHQAMTRAWLFDHHPDPAFQISLIEEAMSNFHRYFFIMPTLARFELEAHRRIEQGEGLNADDMISLMADLFSEGYGGDAPSAMHVDHDRVGITWATFPHLYEDYYVYQYATGIAAAHALAHRILSGAPGAADDYLKFLKAGSSLYPLDALKLAGVDMTTPAPVEAAFETLAGLVERLDTLL